MNTAFEAGYLSGLRGDDPRLCPFEKMTSEWRAWNRGHFLGCEIGIAYGTCA